MSATIWVPTSTIRKGQPDIADSPELVDRKIRPPAVQTTGIEAKREEETARKRTTENERARKEGEENERTRKAEKKKKQKEKTKKEEEPPTHQGEGTHRADSF
ncbi:hypothetical protein EDB19DRAFT_1921207 [Suillus lakei]|nr:hypothetical protein EDB19DRAFT_1921207 [Suillus lakei]